MMMLLQREVVSSTKVAILPSNYQTLAPQAAEYSLACVQLPKDVSRASLSTLKLNMQ